MSEYRRAINLFFLKYIKQMYTNEYYTEAFTSAKQTLNKFSDEIDHEVFNSSPAENKWSIGEIIDHLITVDSDYLGVIEPKIQGDTAHLPKGSGPFKHPFYIRWFIKIVSPEYGRPIPTISQFEPQTSGNLDKETLIQKLQDIQDRYLAIIEKAQKENLDLGKIKVSNPAYSFLKMSVSACLAVNEAHQRRHFQQIENILKA